MTSGGRIRLRPGTLDSLRATLEAPSRRGDHPIVDLLRWETASDTSVIRSATADRLLTDLVALGLVEQAGTGYAPRAHVDLVDSLLIASDLRRNRHSPDFVMGPGPSSLLLARHVRPHTRGRVLDLGTGSGVLGMLVGTDRADVVAVDINPRALRYAAFNAALNRRPRFRPRLGDYLIGPADASLDGRFDTVVANPPFVMNPTAELTYRDWPLARDLVGARTVERVGRALSPGGRGYILCNWIDPQDGTANAADAWLAPVREWLTGLDVDVVVSLVASLEPAEYAAIWTRDLLPTARPAAIAAWAATLREDGARRIDVGVVALSRRARQTAARPRLASVDGRGRRVLWPEIEAAFAT